LVVIEGTAGIGKTRLLGEVRAIAGSVGMQVLAARGGELEGEFEFGIVRQLFEQLLAAAPPNLREELLSGPAELVEPLFGAAQPAGPQDAPAEGSFAILHGLYWLAANVGFHQPTLLAIDDVHWADTPSLEWLLFLTRRLEGLPLLVAAATRPPEAESREPDPVAVSPNHRLLVGNVASLGCASTGITSLPGYEADHLDIHPDEG
jgi:hypothetical protein